MKSKKIKIFFFLFITYSQFSFGQDVKPVDLDKSAFIVKVPKEFRNSGATLTLKIDDEIKSTVTDLTDSIKFVVAKKDDISKIKIIYNNNGYSSESWIGNFKLIGSNKVYADLQANGTIELKQWPLVEFESTDSLTDIEFDGEIIGPTLVSKTVKPNVDHIVKWKEGNIIKCQTILNLTYNLSRRYMCKSNGSLTEN